MASRAAIDIRVTSARGSTTVEYTTKGRYVSFTTSGYQRALTGLPITSTASLSTFWLAILDQVVADIQAHP